MGAGRAAPCPVGHPEGLIAVPRAAVEAVEHAVAVLVARAAQGIHRRAARSLRAAVEAVGDGVAVAVLGQPLGSTRTPASVSGQRSSPSAMLSPSESCVHPVAFTEAPGAVLAQRSTPSGTPSASLSLGTRSRLPARPPGCPGSGRGSPAAVPVAVGDRLAPSMTETQAQAEVGEAAGGAPARFDSPGPRPESTAQGSSPIRTPAPPISAPLLPQMIVAAPLGWTRVPVPGGSGARPADGPSRLPTGML